MKPVCKALAPWVVFSLSLPNPAGAYPEPGRSTLRGQEAREKKPEALSGLEEALRAPYVFYDKFRQQAKPTPAGTLGFIFQARSENGPRFSIHCLPH